MKKLLIIISVFGFLTRIYGQSPNPPGLVIPNGYSLFNSAYTLQEQTFYGSYLESVLRSSDTTDLTGKVQYEFAYDMQKEVLSNALFYYNNLLEYFPNSAFVPEAIYNMGSIELKLGDTTNSLKHYNQYIEFEADDSTVFEDYKNYSCISIAEVYIAQKQYDKSIEYLNISKKYRPNFICGNAYENHKFMLAKLYAECLYGMGQVDSALALTLPHVFPNGIGFNNEIVEFSVRILKKEYDNKTIKKKLDSAIDKLYYKDDNMYWCYINFLDVEIPISYFIDFENKKHPDEEVINYIKSTAFYTQLTSN